MNQGSEKEKTMQELSAELERVNKELERANRELKISARSDALTGVFNRLVFDSILKAEWERCKRHLIPLSLIMINIDFFKAYNEHYGHQAGDDSLRRVAGALLISARRSSDTVSRYSGDEFAIIVPHLDKNYAFDLADQIRGKVAELGIPHEYSLAARHLTISIGVHTVIPDDQLSVNDFIRTAEIALSEAKKGHDSIVVE